MRGMKRSHCKKSMQDGIYCWAPLENTICWIPTWLFGVLSVTNTRHGGPRHGTQDPHTFATPSGSSTCFFQISLLLNFKYCPYRSLTHSIHYCSRRHSSLPQTISLSVQSQRLNVHLAGLPISILLTTVL